MARAAFQSSAVLHDRYRRFAMGTRENFEQFRIDSHVQNI
jgi:hypothetical protein